MLFKFSLLLFGTVFAVKQTSAFFTNNNNNNGNYCPQGFMECLDRECRYFGNEFNNDAYRRGGRGGFGNENGRRENGNNRGNAGMARREGGGDYPREDRRREMEECVERKMRDRGFNNNNNNRNNNNNFNSKCNPQRWIQACENSPFGSTQQGGSTLGALGGLLNGGGMLNGGGGMLGWLAKMFGGAGNNNGSGFDYNGNGGCDENESQRQRCAEKCIRNVPECSNDFNMPNNRCSEERREIERECREQINGGNRSPFGSDQSRG